MVAPIDVSAARPGCGRDGIEQRGVGIRTWLAAPPSPLAPAVLDEALTGRLDQGGGTEAAHVPVPRGVEGGRRRHLLHGPTRDAPTAAARSGRSPSATLGPVGAHRRTALFDLDGTLVDSDAALMAPFVELGVSPERMPPLGLPLGEACTRAGVPVDEYLARYDVSIVMPFPGVEELLRALPRWAVCSNKARASGHRELARLGWAPDLALFSEDFGGRPKHLGPALEVLGLDPAAAVFVGDTAHDRACAAAVGATFALAGWNARATREPGDLVLSRPEEVLELLR